MRLKLLYREFLIYFALKPEPYDVNKVDLSRLISITSLQQVLRAWEVSNAILQLLFFFVDVPIHCGKQLKKLTHKIIVFTLRVSG